MDLKTLVEVKERLTARREQVIDAAGKVTLPRGINEYDRKHLKEIAALYFDTTIEIVSQMIDEEIKKK